MDPSQYGSCVPTTICVQQMRMIRNLIEVKVPEVELEAANFKDGLRIQVKSEKPFIVNAFWIVKIVDIHAAIEKDWKALLRELTEGKFLTGECRQQPGTKSSLYQSERQIYHEIQKQVQCEVKPPCDIDTSRMTQKPRDFYPLVVIVTCLDEDPDPVGSAAGANIHIIHIKDSIVPVRSHVIKQYIKQIDGRILDISQLYQEETAACFICFEEADPMAKLRLFCLLPCRHSPICSICILRIRECPKCRCPIASVFDINSPGVESTPPSNAPRPAIDPSLRHLYDSQTDSQSNNDSSTEGRQEQRGGILSKLRSLIGI